VIELRTEVPVPEIEPKTLKATAQRLLSATGRGTAELSVLLTGDAQMRALNRTHRGKDKATDVLSFPAPSPRSRHAARATLGDIAISVDTARRQAAEYDAPLQSEIHRLLIHGILHVLGHDHHDARERAIMEAEEKRLARFISMPWPYD